MLKRLLKKAKFKILGETEDLNINMAPGDSLALYAGDSDDPVLVREINKNMKVDRAVIFEVENALGMEEGIGGAFGKKK